MRYLPPKPSSFSQRAVANHLLFVSMAIVVLAWSALTRAGGFDAHFTQANFDALARFVDYKQVGIPVAGGFLLYLVISLLSHQSGSILAEVKAYHWRELIHAEVSSILLSSSSLSFVVGALFCWVGLFNEGLRTASWWPIGLILAYLLRPKTQDRYDEV
ncbi:hypothetical protein [Pseudogulbenkiania sp. MAI-1]|uniref:hypothetical protein n=1 Tax=Pseudogulbenkiania sp. MAI-1 TaxID=990370 RepID=UPI00045E6A97|nr:hypothetical protein [Pseudogulbenkiania sp. MAI-1]